MILVYDYLKPLTPEEREAQTRQEIEERQIKVKQAQEKARMQRKQEQENKSTIAKIEKEETKRKEEAFQREVTQGLSKTQIKDLERLQQIKVSLGHHTNNPDKVAELQAEYNVILADLIKDGKNMGTITFTPHTYYTSESGIILLPKENGKGYTLREGTLGKFEITNKTLQCDSNGLPSKITQPSVIPRSNIQLPDTWNVRIQEQQPKEVPTKTGVSKVLKFQSKEELEKDKRQLTNKEVKQRKKLF
jgi:hypothetical protein